jgi:hypothetical protein
MRNTQQVKEGTVMDLHHSGNTGKYLYNSPSLTWERVPTTIPHVWIEHLRLNDRDVLIVNDELDGFDMDTQSEKARYSLIEKTFPEVEKVGYRLGGCIEVADDETAEKLRKFTF